jgi:spermidine synthase
VRQSFVNGESALEHSFTLAAPPDGRDPDSETRITVDLAVGALLFNFIRPRITDPVRLLAVAQMLVAGLVLLGLVGVVVRPEFFTPSQSLATLRALAGSAILVVLPVTVVMGLSFPAASALVADDARHAGRESGSLIAVNTVGAISASIIIPFVLIPLLGSPVVVVLLALVNALLGSRSRFGCAFRVVRSSRSDSWSP